MCENSSAGPCRILTRPVGQKHGGTVRLILPIYVVLTYSFAPINLHIDVELCPFFPSIWLFPTTLDAIKRELGIYNPDIQVLNEDLGLLKDPSLLR